MAQKASVHGVYLEIDQKTKLIDEARLPHGCKLVSEESCKTSIVPESFLKTGDRNKISAPLPGYIYLDVGVWAGNIYNFGLICGRNVWLCNFIHNEEHKPVGKEIWWQSCSEDSEPMKVFENEMASTKKHGFSVKFYAHVPGEAPPSSDLLYLILPDMHLTAIPHYKEFTNKTDAEIAALSRDGLKAMNLDHRVEPVPNVRREELTRYSAYKQGKNADIFGKAGEALCDFLDFVISMLKGKLDIKIKVVQVGDFYELWQGMGEWNTYFDDDPNTKGLIFEKDAIKILKERISGIETQHKMLLSKFKYLDDLNAIVYIYGNHDIYMVDKMREKNKEWDIALGERFPRLTHLHENNMAFEHGHRMQTSNFDGKLLGSFMAELVFWAPGLRYLEPDRRELYHRLSAIEVYYHNYLMNKPISVFIMGHTHKADLKYIKFYRLQPSDLRRKKSFCITCIPPKIEPLPKI